MRLFVALWPPADAVTELTAAVAAAEPRGPAVRWVAAEQWHLTLAFLGEVADARRPALERRLERVGERYPPLALQLAGVGRFGDRALFVKVMGERGALSRLAASTTAAARRAAVPVDDRPFRAHVTIARGRPGTDFRPLAAALSGYRGGSWTATHVQLVSSRLGAGPGGGSAYETVAAWPLAGRGDRRPHGDVGRP